MRLALILLLALSGCTPTPAFSRDNIMSGPEPFGFFAGLGALVFLGCCGYAMVRYANYKFFEVPPKFTPCIIYNEELRLTELILEDVSIVWCPWGPYEGHAVDCGYSSDGRLVGIKIWDDVRQRPQRDAQ